MSAPHMTRARLAMFYRELASARRQLARVAPLLPPDHNHVVAIKTLISDKLAFIAAARAMLPRGRRVPERSNCERTLPAPRRASRIVRRSLSRVGVRNARLCRVPRMAEWNRSDVHAHSSRHDGDAGRTIRGVETAGRSPPNRARTAT